jgi:hypothetical protein
VSEGERPPDPPAFDPFAPDPPGAPPFESRWFEPDPPPLGWPHWESVTARAQRLGYPPPADSEETRRAAQVMHEAVTLTITGTIGTAVTYRREDGTEGIGIIPPASPEKPPAVADPFRGGAGVVRSEYPVIATLQAINHGGSTSGWSDNNGTSEPTYTYRGGKGAGRAFILLRNDRTLAQATPEALAAVWGRVRALDDWTSDALCVALARLEEEGRSPNEDVWLTTAAVLDARGIKRMTRAGEPGNWTHGHRTADLARAGRALKQLETLSIVLDQVRVTRGVTKSGRARPASIVTHRSRLLTLSGEVARKDGAGAEYLVAARVGFGEWAEVFWELGVRQVARLNRKALAYDPVAEQVEKRLAKYLAFHFRRNSGDRVRLRVETMLGEVDLAPQRDRPQRTRDRLEKALRRLHDDELLAGWGYTNDAPDALPVRGWLRPWLTSTVWLTPPPDPGAPSVQLPLELAAAP